jgi:predicted O-methyltransferase YrrM
LKRIKKLFKRIRKLRTRAKQLLAIDPNTYVAAQMALTEARKSATVDNPRQALDFFIECLRPLSFSSVDKAHQANPEHLSRVLGMLQLPDATLPLSIALPIVLYADTMLSNFGVEPFAGDIGVHFSSSSSLAWKARFVFNLVRVLKPKACLELGTAYGIATYLIARCQELCGLPANVVTIENFSPQKEISQAFLQKHFPLTVKTLHADKQDAIAQLVTASEQFDFVFHDAAHSGDHYVRDFTELLPLMPAGAVFALDDINWEGHGQGHSKRTCYEGWSEIIQHDRVAAAIEVWNSIGLIFLR